MDAPQLPDAEASAEPVGEQPPGQASAFRRALDAQVEPIEPSMALVPTGLHDITAPIDVDVLRALLAPGKSPAAPNGGPNAPSGLTGLPVNAASGSGIVGTQTSIAEMPPMFPAAATLPIPTAPVPAAPVSTASIPTASIPTGPNAIVPNPMAPPSASGPTVVMPSVSAPALLAPTTITTAGGAAVANTANVLAPGAASNSNGSATFAAVPAVPGPATVSAPSAAGDGHGDGPPPQPSPRHNAKPSRLPTAVWISALLAACAGAALVLFDTGRSSDPLAPTSLPTRPAAQSPSPHHAHPAPPPKPSPSHSPSPSPSHPSASPSHSPSPSPSPSPSHPSASPSPSPSAVASFATIYWTMSADARVADIQRRLATLNYLRLNANNQYADASRTTSEAGWRPRPDDVGYYQNATDLAVRAFEFDYIQHGQGQPPPPGCDTQTYQALVNATS